MKKIIFLCICFGVTFFLHAEVSKTLNINAGGLLNALEVSDFNNLTELTITGTIDARDFVTINTKLSALKVLDISGTAILEYTGMAGPSSTLNYTYPANSVPDYSFFKNTTSYLTTVELPSSITSIGKSAFQGLIHLKSIYLPSSVSTIGESAFMNCSAYMTIDANNEAYSSEDGILFNKNKTILIQAPITLKGNYYIPSTVTTIGYGAFSYSALRFVSIPASVTSIGRFAFNSCGSLYTVYVHSAMLLPVDVSTFAYGYQYNRNVYVPAALVESYKAADNWKTFSVGAIPSWSLKKTLQVDTPGTLSTLLSNEELYSITDLTITGTIDARDFVIIRAMHVLTNLDLSGVNIAAYTGLEGPIRTISTTYGANAIPSNAFYQTNAYVHFVSLESILLPPTITSIGSYAFIYCSSLKSVVIPTKVTAIAQYAFGYCSDLTTLSIPPSVVSIGDNAFHSCVQLSTVHIPASVTSLGTGAFYGCQNLTTVYAYDYTPILLSPTYIYFSSISRCSLYVPAGMVDTYKAANVWKDFGTISEMPTPEPRHKTINSSIPGSLLGLLTMDECYTISSLTLTGNIDARDFKTLRHLIPFLKTLDLSGATIVAYSGTQATSEYTATPIDYPANTIPVDAFVVSKSMLTSVILPSNLTAIGKYAFAKCTNLTTIEIPGSVLSIGDFAFQDCSGLTNVGYQTPSAVTYIGNYTFDDCLGLTSFTIPASVQTLGNSSMDNPKLTSIYAYPAIPVDLSSAQFNDFTYVNINTCILWVPVGSVGAYRSAEKWKVFKRIWEMKNVNLSADSIQIAPTAASVASVEVYSKINWSASSDQSWLVVTPTSGSGGITALTLTAQANTGAIRFATVTVTANGESPQTIKVLQAPLNPTLSVSASNATLASAANSSASVDVASNTIWTASSDQTWLTVSPNGATSGNATLTFTATANTGAVRSATVTLTASEVLSKVVTVTQNSNTTTLTVTTTVASLTKMEGSSATVTVMSNTTWLASSNQGWLTVNPTVATTGNALLLLTASENTGETRSAIVTVSAPGAPTRTILVTQSSGIIVSLSKDVTAGTLATTLSAIELASVTNLTLTGTIDGRDFTTMRDLMPSLSVLDLSGVTIVSFTGIGGPAGAPVNSKNPSGLSRSAEVVSATYLANTIPQYAFYSASAQSGKKTLTSIVLPSTLTTIDNMAFMYCLGLTSITLPNTTTTIGMGAFLFCTSLQSITLPESVTTIGASAFMLCGAAFNVDPNNKVYSSTDGVLFNKLQTILIQCPASKVGVYNVPSSVTSMVSGSFSYCSLLTSITLPTSITAIESGVFSNCVSLQSMYLPNTITSIGASAFIGCTGLNSIVLPSSITTIGANVFSGCTNLTSIYAQAVLPVSLATSSNVFYNVSKTNCKVYVPIGSLNAYKSALQWLDFTSIVESAMSVQKPEIQNLVIYPNPVKNHFTISGLDESGMLLLLDLNGRVLIHKKVGGNESVSVQEIPNGVYLVKISTPNGWSNMKLVKE